MVVLHLAQGQALLVGHLARPFAREVLGMHVAGQDLGSKAEKPLVLAERAAPGVERVGVFQIAQVLADEGLLAAREAEGGLLLGAAGKHAGQARAARVDAGRVGELHGRGGDAAGAAHDLRAATLHAHDRVIVASQDGAVVAQPGVGHVDEARHGHLVVADDGLVGEVAARHHQRRPHGAQQQVLQGRVGKHGAQLGQVARHARRNRQILRHARRILAAQQHDGGAGAYELGALGVAHLAHLAQGVEVGKHHGQRLGGAVLALAQLSHGCLVACVAGKVEAAQALDGHDAAVLEHLRRSGDDVVRRCEVASAQHAPRFFGGAPGELRSAGEARVGLGMEAPVSRVCVLTGARRAHRKARHGRAGAVVGELVDDGEARPAVGAVDKRVVVPAVFWIKKLAQAVGARGDVGAHERREVLLGRALHNAEVAAGHSARHPQLLMGAGGRDMAVVEGVDVHGVHTCGCRVLGGEGEHKAVECRGVALCLDVHAVAGVLHPTGESQRGGELPHEGAIAHALHDAAHMYVYPRHVSPRSSTGSPPRSACSARPP